MKALIMFMTAMLLGAGSAGEARAQVNLGLSIGEEGLRGFYLGVGEYFRVPQREIIIIKERRVPSEEIPVVLLIAQQARVAPSSVIDLRLRGDSWLDITIRYGLSPEIYYVPVPVTVKGPPYGKAYGHYKKRPRHEWKKIVLSDDDVINLVNLKFVSEHYGHPAEEVIKQRSGGKDFVVIHQEFRKGKEKERKEVAEYGEKHQKGMKQQKGKGGEKGKGQGKGRE